MVFLIFMAVAAVLVVGVAPVRAEGVDLLPDRMFLTFGSLHVDQPRDFREVNPGGIVAWDAGQVEIGAGAFVNSHRDVAPVVAVSRELLRWRDGALSGFAGIAHYGAEAARMPISLGPIIPVAGLSLRQGPFFLNAMPHDGVRPLVVFGLTAPLDLKDLLQ